MSQLSYPINQNEAVLGMLADSAYKHTDSKIAKGAIPVGSGVAKVFGKDDQARLPAANQGVLLFAGDFITSNVIDLDINGVAITSVTFASDHDTTAELLRVEIEANADVVTCVLDPDDATNKTFIVTGVDETTIAITGILVTLGSTQTTGTFTIGTRDSLYGIAHWTQALEGGLPNVEATPEYADKALVNTLRRGSVWVWFETAFDLDSDTLYCRFIDGGTGKAIGQFRNDADSATAFAVAGNFQVRKTLSAAGLGVIELNKPV